MIQTAVNQTMNIFIWLLITIAWTGKMCRWYSRYMTDMMDLHYSSLVWLGPFSLLYTCLRIGSFLYHLYNNVCPILRINMSSLNRLWIRPDYMKRMKKKVDSKVWPKNKVLHSEKHLGIESERLVSKLPIHVQYTYTAVVHNFFSANEHQTIHAWCLRVENFYTTSSTHSYRSVVCVNFNHIQYISLFSLL